jgi:hypothetical protein
MVFGGGGGGCGGDIYKFVLYACIYTIFACVGCKKKCTKFSW